MSNDMKLVVSISKDTLDLIDTLLITTKELVARFNEDVCVSGAVSINGFDNVISKIDTTYSIDTEEAK